MRRRAHATGHRRVASGSVAWCLALTAFLAVCLSRAPAATAAEPPLRFLHLGVDEGLSGNWVLAVLRDSRGFLWVGTQDGLNRYDGRSFVAYHHSKSDPNSLPSSVAGVLFEDSRGRLWVGSRWASEGMALYDRARDRFVRLPCGPGSGGLSDARVNAIIEETEGRLFVGTQKGVDLVDYEKKVFENYGFDPLEKGRKAPRQTTALLRDRAGRLWVGTTEGLYRLDSDRKRCVPWRGFGGDGTDGLNRGRVEALLEDTSGTIWVATLTSGLFAIDPAGKRLRHFVPRPGDPTSLSHLRVRSLALDEAGLLWVGTENGGLSALDRHTGRFERYGPDPFAPSALGSASIYALLSDRQGILWIGTYDNGLNYLTPSEQRFGRVTPSQDGLRDPRVSAFLEDRAGNLWIGTDGGGLNRVDARTEQYTYVTHDPENPTTIGSGSVLTLLETADGMIWLGGWGGGLSRLDPQTGEVRRFRHSAEDAATIIGNDVWRVRRLQSGELLVATQQGTDLFDPIGGGFSRLSARYHGIEDRMTLAVIETADGDIWIGQSGRTQHISPKTGKVTTYAYLSHGPSRLGSGQVFVIYEDSRKNVWIGGEGGLRCLPSSRPLGSNLVTVNGLPHRVVTNVLEDATGNIWVTTNRGLTKLENAVQDPARPTLVHFSADDGLQGSEYSRGAALKGRDGRFYFGGPRGFNVFKPEEIHLNTQPPPVVLTDLRVFNRSVLPGGPDSPLTRSITETAALSISQDLFVLTFEFAALNLVLPQKNRYAYMLEGLESAWNEAGTRREATYTQLGRGDYVFRVRACNNDGVWNNAGLSLKLHVAPRWHEVRSTRVLLALLTALLVIGMVGRRLRQHTARERELSRRVEERTHALNLLNEELEQRVAARTTELEEETERLSVTLSSIGDAVIATDVDSRVVLMNRIAEQLTGWSADEARGHRLGEVMPRYDLESRKPQPDPVAAVLGEEATGSPTAESGLTRPDGEERVVAQSAAPIRDRAGRTLGVVLAFRDVTEQRQVEAQLLNNQKLEALGILAGGIAHDFNNLLTGVFGYIEMVKRRSTDRPKEMEIMTKALSLIERARGLTGQLITFSRGGGPVTAPLALGDLLRRNVEFALSGSNVACELRIADDLWVCLGDRRQIDQVVDNLLLNARQSMPDGGTVVLVAQNVLVTEETGIPLRTGRYVRVTVSDQGSGIPKEIQSRIFEPFFTTKPEGTGLGLATTYSIVRKHGGHIEVTSETGKGTRFCLYLPASEDQVRALFGSMPPATTRQCRILLMDDEAYVREVVQDMLRELGHAVEAVADGPATVAAYESARASGSPFDLVLLDLTIPGGPGGRAVLASLLEVDPAVRAVAASGYFADPAMTDPFAHGFAGKLAKPYTIDDLAHVIALAMRVRRAL